ncbi:hypothetical protein IKN40_06650 [bacterium]|nr:hypothetical protein [bacterium]
MDLFLNNETDNSILEAQYVIVSNRIRREDVTYENIISANVLFPDPSTMCALNEDDFRHNYCDQLSDHLTLLAVIISDAILHNHNIIFICTHKESKLSKFIYILAEFIYGEFGYPVYDYKKLAKGKIDFVDYNESKVYKKCKSIIDDAKYTEMITNIKSDKKLKNKEKKHLKSLLKREGLYKKGMSTYEMRNLVDVVISENQKG